MLRKATTLNEAVRIVLLCDPAVWEAQIRAARTEVDSHLDKAEGFEFVDKVVEVLRATTKSHVEMIESLSALKGSARELFEGFLSDEGSKAEAMEKLTKAMADEDTRTALAFTRAHGIVSTYRETSNPASLADPNPEGASWVTIKALSREDIRESERAAGVRPALGAVLAGKGLDVARRAARQGQDSAEAYARYMSGLSEDEQREVFKFEDYNACLDREFFRRAVHGVDGFEIERDAAGFPVERFEAECADAESVISEVSRHARQIGQLDPKVSWPPSWRSGTSESKNEAAA